MNTKNIKLNIKENIAELCFDLENEKVNKLSQEVLKELATILEEIKHNSSIKILFITSAKENIFIAGADITEIKQMTNEEEIFNVLESINAIFCTLEELPFPTVAIINGACMGGGLELALSCTYRIATTEAKTKIAFPEIKLGIFPGFGGTQRAPKLVGLINALDLILTGKTIDAQKAYRIGLVNKYFSEGQLEFKKEEFVKEVLSDTVKKQKNKNQYMEYFGITRDIIYKKAKANLVKKVHPSFKGPYAALEVIEQTFGGNLKEGLKIEAKNFSHLAVTLESKNLIDLFFISEEVKKDYKNVAFNGKIERTSVIGNGVMGKGIIWLFSKYANDVRIKLRKLEQVKGILNATSKLYSFFIKTRKMTKKQVEFKLNKISYSDKFDGFNLTDLSIEAIVEDKVQKQLTYKELEDKLDKNAIIATNTSSISINSLSENLKHKERFLGIHFFNPVNKMPLVEVIPSQHTSQENIAKSFEFLRRCGKMPILVGDCAGFLVNRVLIPYINEAGFMLEDGNSIETIDKTLTQFGMPMGAFILADEVGLDVGLKVADILEEAYGNRMQVSKVLRMVHDDLKLLGKKSGKGFYIHDKQNGRIVNEEIQKRVSINGNSNPSEIINRAIFIMINEASRCLEEGIIQKASHLDFAMIAGTGFPAFRGGLLKYADNRGIEYIINKLESYRTLYGERFTPSELLYTLQKDKKTFYTGETLWKR